MTTPPAHATTEPAVPLRPLGVGELLDGAIRCVRHNLRASLTLAFPVAVLRVALLAALSYGTVADEDFATAQLAAQTFISALFGTTLAGLLAPVFAGELLGRRIGAATALKQIGGRVVPLLVLALAVAVAQEVGIVLLFVGGAWLWGIWAVAAPAATIERLGPWRALGRSFALVRKDFWRVWGIRSLRWLVVYVVGALATVPFTLLAVAVAGGDFFGGSGIDDTGLYVLLTSVGTLIALTVTTPVSAAVDALLYLDLRMRREGMDLVLALPQPEPVDRPAPVTAW